MYKLSFIVFGEFYDLYIITALHGMQTRSSDENSVRLSCPSVRPSNPWIVTKRKKDMSRFLYRTKDRLA